MSCIRNELGLHPVCLDLNAIGYLGSAPVRDTFRQFNTNELTLSLTSHSKVFFLLVPHGWTVDQLLKLHVCFAYPDKQDSNDIKNMLYTLGPRLPRSYFSVLCNTTTPIPNTLGLVGSIPSGNGVHGFGPLW